MKRKNAVQKAIVISAKSYQNDFESSLAKKKKKTDRNSKNGKKVKHFMCKIRNHIM